MWISVSTDFVVQCLGCFVLVVLVIAIALELIRRKVRRRRR